MSLKTKNLILSFSDHGTLRQLSAYIHLKNILAYLLTTTTTTTRSV